MEILDTQAMTAQKPSKNPCSSITMGFVHKKVRGGTNHAHSIKEAMGTQISILISLLDGFNLWSDKDKRYNPKETDRQ